jgi:transaldolase
MVLSPQEKKDLIIVYLQPTSPFRKIEDLASSLKLFSYQNYETLISVKDITEFVKTGKIDGITTNPTLMYKSGIRDYAKFIEDANKVSNGLPISYEVISDSDNEILREAKILNILGINAWVKIPVIKSNGDSNIKLINTCLADGIKINITAVFDVSQLVGLIETSKDSCIISIFAGRIADAGIDPEEVVKTFKQSELSEKTNLLWASTREAFNIIQAERAGCDIVTVQPELLFKTNN